MRRDGIQREVKGRKGAIFLKESRAASSRGEADGLDSIFRVNWAKLTDETYLLKSRITVMLPTSELDGLWYNEHSNTVKTARGMFLVESQECNSGHML